MLQSAKLSKTKKHEKIHAFHQQRKAMKANNYKQILQPLQGRIAMGSSTMIYNINSDQRLLVNNTSPQHVSTTLLHNTSQTENTERKYAQTENTDRKRTRKTHTHRKHREKTQRETTEKKRRQKRHRKHRKKQFHRKGFQNDLVVRGVFQISQKKRPK